MKRFIILAISCMIMIILTGCINQSITIIGEKSIEVGCSTLLEVDYDGTEKLVWSSSDSNVASVIDGTVIGHKEGKVTITVKAGNSKGTFDIEITPIIYTVTIFGTPTIKEGTNYKFTYETSKDVDFEPIWSSNMNNIAYVENDGTVYGIAPGKAIITLQIGKIIESYEITILEDMPYNITVDTPSSLEPGQSYTLNPVVDTTNEVSLIYTSLTKEILSVDDKGLVTALKEGIGQIEISVLEKPKSKIVVTITIEDNIPNEIRLSGKTNIEMGEHTNISAEFIGNGSKEIVWRSSNSNIVDVYHGIVLGLQCGTSVITATSVLDDSVYGSIEITVSKYISAEPTKEQLDRVNSIIDKMSLSQKVGQMFFVGFSGTSMPSNLSNAITNYNFGNVIYMGQNVSNTSTFASMSNAIQNKMVSSNLVPGFISTDQEGGNVARIKSGGTHFISQMAIAATNDPNNAYLEGLAVGKELNSYGINMDFAPVLDINNNPDNPIIGIRSYSDNPLIASLFGNNFIKGLQESGTIACPKHFPGHGNTAVDSHYGLPIITSSMNELYQVELAPFISAIKNGVDAIMTTHIIFEAIDTTYPATLSEKVLTGLLRKELNYNGLIITDGMQMDAIRKYFGTSDVTSIQAIKAGVDILLYTSLNDPMTAHTAIVKAVRNGEITEERINESVRRILLTKLERGILDNYIVKDLDRTNMINEHYELNLSFAQNGLTQVIGSFDGLYKSKSTLIISPTTSNTLGSGLASNSLACYAAKYLKEHGHSNVSYKTVDKNISSTDSTSILSSISDYDQIVVAFSNVKTSKYTNTANFVNNLLSKHNNVIVIALDTPYDALSYNNSLNNYICVFGYQFATTDAITKYLNGEFNAQGVSPVDTNEFKN